MKSFFESFSPSRRPIHIYPVFFGSFCSNSFSVKLKGSMLLTFNAFSILQRLWVLVCWRQIYSTLLFNCYRLNNSFQSLTLQMYREHICIIRQYEILRLMWAAHVKCSFCLSVLGLCVHRVFEVPSSLCCLTKHMYPQACVLHI